ncbi:MAG: hypothetical protein IPP52_15515 [Ignavibacteria bacterium]|nr:hypothetical protein [Ignavibacteria bacterium]
MMLNLEIIKALTAENLLTMRLGCCLKITKDSSKGYSDMRVKEVAETVWEKILMTSGINIFAERKTLANEYLDSAGLKLVNEIETDSIIPILKSSL